MGMAANQFSNLSFPTPGRLQMKFEQHWPRGLEEKSFVILNIFPIQMHGEANDPAVKRSNVNLRPSF